MTIRHENAWEMQCFLKQCKSILFYKANSPSSDKNTNRFRWSTMSVHSADAFRHATEWVGAEIQRFFSACPILHCRKERVVLILLLKNRHENSEENSTAYWMLSFAVFFTFLHSLEYINYILEWYLLRCFYSRIRNFHKKFWKRRERSFQKNVFPDTKTAYYFSKTRQKYFW